LKAVVTGGAGFIGSHLVDRLVSEGYSVTVLDNMSYGFLENLEGHRNDEGVTVLDVDLRDAKRLEEVFRGHDVVFHMAAHADIRRSLEDHRADLENNVLGTLNVLEAMYKNRVQNLVFASTSALYGEAEVMPTPEDWSPVQTSLYGASKLACAAYMEAYTQFSPLKFWSFRFSNVVGERCRRGVIWDFVHELRSNPRELEILGDGRQSKEYLYVKDCVDGIMVGYRRASGSVNVFNLAIEEQTKVDRVADIVIEEMGLNNVKRKYTGGPRGWIGDNPVVVLSIDRIKKLGWKPKISSEEAIRRTVRWTLNEVKR